MSQSGFLTVDEVAKNLKVTRQTISKYIKANELNAIKMNKSYRIAYNDFENFITSKSIKGEPKFTYFSKSKNCTLEYPNKIDESEIRDSPTTGFIKLIEKQHDLDNNYFIFGDNYHVLKNLLHTHSGKIDLIYIDPPFATGRDYNSVDDNNAYSDKLLDNEFLEFLRKRLILLKDLLSEEGSIYLHIDKKIGHYVKIIMDEIFGYQNFINDITRIKCNPKNFSRNAFGNYSDIILFYAKNRDFNIWNDVTEKMSVAKMRELYTKKHPKFGHYTTNPIHAPGKTLDGDTGKEWKGLLPPKGRHWRYSREYLTELDCKGLIEWSTTGNPRKIVFAKEHKGFKIQDVWEFKDKGLSYVDYPTQKNRDLLRRIVLNSSNEDSIVLDCFAGSGGTLSIANELNRKWIGVDNSTHSYDVIKSSFKRDEIKCNFYEFTATR